MDMCIGVGGGGVAQEDHCSDKSHAEDGIRASEHEQRMHERSAKSLAAEELEDKPGPLVRVDTEGFLQCMADAPEDGEYGTRLGPGLGHFDQQAIACHLKHLGVYLARDVFLEHEINEMSENLYDHYAENDIRAGFQYRNLSALSNTSQEDHRLADIRNSVLRNPQYVELVWKSIGGTPEFCFESAIELCLGASNSGWWHRDVDPEMLALPEYRTLPEDAGVTDSSTRTFRFVFFLEDHVKGDGFRYIPGTHRVSNVTLQSGQHVLLRHRKTDVLVFDPLVVHSGNDKVEEDAPRSLVHFTFGLANHYSRKDRTAHELIRFQPSTIIPSLPDDSRQAFQSAGIAVPPSGYDICKDYTDPHRCPPT